MSFYASPVEKAHVVEAELGNASDRSGQGQIVHVDGLTTPGTTLESFSHIDEKKILRKVVIVLTNHFPNVGGNIGNAKIEGLQEDLKMEPDQYNWCLTVFFFTYAAFEVPSNLLLKKLRPRLPTIMVA
ncbi:hypothetical protein QQZ08_000738 [Neonectria magnoliae]|uniref:Uncharacterized protein n=1 Tax=Neonectria magnoliae TaxID=2732573 RepID=A0ABR1IIN5_9HYPO